MRSRISRGPPLTAFARPGLAFCFAALGIGCSSLPEAGAGHPAVAEPASPWQQVQTRCDAAGLAVEPRTVPIYVRTARGGVERYRRTVNLICTPR